MVKINNIYNVDCIEFMKSIGTESVDLTLTDIPYGEVNRNSNGLRNLDKSLADIMQFDMQDFFATSIQNIEKYNYYFLW